MSREEDLIRSTTRAIALAVREVPPLRLEPAADELRAAARAARRGAGGDAGGRGRQHRWRTWAAPVTAAAVVVVLAIALVLVKDLPNGGAVPANRATSTTGPAGAPRYYVALKDIPGTMKQQLAGVLQCDIVVGDSLTGKTLATFAPPARTTFQSVSAAADDRTFVIFAVTTADPSGSFGPGPKNITLTGSWYKLQLAPGTAHPAGLSKLPVKPQSWSELHDKTTYNTPSAGQVFATALSQSGQELAVADLPQVPAADKPENWQEVKVFSVSTGRLLHAWTSHVPGVSFQAIISDTLADVPTGTPVLTWIDGDKALAVATAVSPKAGVDIGTVRRLGVAGPPSGNLMTDSTVVRSATLPWNQSGGCFFEDDWPPLISANGKTISCGTFVMPYATPGQVNFSTYPLTPGPKGILDYRATIPPEKQTGGVSFNVLYVSPSGGTLIVNWVNDGKLPLDKRAFFGVASHGKFTRLPIPASMASSLIEAITF
jgi:hypothetical protein